MLEAGVLISKLDIPIHWHLPNLRSMVYLPDSRDLWNIIFENRNILKGFAHSHPGSGIPSPSMEDLTTFSAVELGLGNRLKWWITSADKLIELEWEGPKKYDYQSKILDLSFDFDWVNDLRKYSNYF